jgi:cation diffusion facilitator family transporter
VEQRALKISAVGNLFMAGLGIGFALLVGSDAIMLDGFLSLAGFVMALLTVRVASIVAQPDDVHFQFGYASFEPALNTVRGIVLLIVSAYAFVGAIQAILDGGRELALGWAIVYAVVASLGCLALGVNARRAATKTGSPLLEVDARSWLIDGALSIGVALAFVAAFFLARSPWSHLTRYVDPALVAILVVAVIGTPLGVVRKGLGELLLAAPSEEEQRDLRSRFGAATTKFGLEAVHLRMMRVGRSIFLLVHARVPEGSDWSVSKLDA